MQISDFTDDKAGRIVQIQQECIAFIPDPLSPKLEPSWKLLQLLSDADRSIAELAGVGGNLPNPHLLIAPFIRREAVASSRLEGTRAGISDLLFFEAYPDDSKKTTRCP